MISKVYTRTGDAGTTSLVSGTRVDKDDVRVEAYGTVDELNSNIGVLLHSTKLDYPEIIALLRKAQNKLFNIGAYLANDKADALYGVKKEDVEELEKMMDVMNEDVPPAQGFVLPGGTQAAAQAHVARTVCRRAERRIAALAEVAEVGEDIQQYVNRLSDYLFVLAKIVNFNNGQAEIIWQNACK